MSSLVVIFYHTEYIQGMLTKFVAANPFLFVVAFVGIQGVIEAGVCFVIASIISRVLYPIVKKDQIPATAKS